VTSTKFHHTTSRSVSSDVAVLRETFVEPWQILLVCHFNDVHVLYEDTTTAVNRIQCSVRQRITAGGL